MGKLSTHVLDTMHGRPGAGVAIALYRIENDRRTLVKRVVTNQDGRCDEALLEGEALQCAIYELVFGAGDYFAAAGVSLPQPRFLDEIVVRFGIHDAHQNYHVPIVMSPWAYSTYRGS